MIEKNKIYLGNNLEILKTFPDNSIDSIVTDPPYGLGKEPNAYEVLKAWITDGYYEVEGKGFMGKEWDAFVPQPNFWKEIYRVLKPGGYVLSFAGTRTYDWMVMAVRLAGFEIRDMIAWLYGSGFPKSLNVAKAISAYERTGGSSPKNLRKDRQGDDYKPTGQKDYQKGRAFSNEIKDDNKKTELTDQAKQWQGWGTALKPSVEPIVMARKPIKESTIAKNIIKYGTGAINIDECRVPYQENEPDKRVGTDFVSDGKNLKDNKSMFGNTKYYAQMYENKGRYPANIIHDGSEEVEKIFPNTTSTSGSFKASDYEDGKGVLNFTRGDFEGYGDSGSASRFFYVAKASQDERNWGLEHLEAKEIRGGGGRVEKGYDENNEEDMRLKKSAQAFGAVQAIKQNIHPTVKPLELMRYLVKMVTPKGGTVLDPFVGSGTTAIASKLEKFNYIGIELMPEYVEIAEARLKAYNVIQYDIFDFMEE